MAASVITRASLVDNVTLWSAATVNSAVYDAIDSMFGGAGSYTTFEFGGAVKVTGALTPVTNDGAALGSATVSWADLFLASGGVINFNNGDVTVTHSTNTLTFAGASSGYVFDDHLKFTVGKYLDWGTTVGSFGGRFGRYVTGSFLIGVPGTSASETCLVVDSAGATIAEFRGDKTVSLLGNVGIGVTPGSVRLDIVGSTDAIRVSQSTTNATSKDGKYLQRHYTNSEEDLLVAYSYSTSTDNGLAFGGGSGAQNAATLIGFYTAANNTTVSGTERLRINSSGHVGIGATARFYLDGVAGTGDTYIHENSSNLLITVVGGTNLFASVNNPTKYNFSYEDFAVDSGKKLFVDGLSNTYFIEGASDRIDVVTGGSTKMEIGAGGGNLYVRFVNGLYMTTWPTTANAANAWVGNGGVLSLSTSSIRYKHDIATLDTTDALSAVMAMRPVTYRGKTDEDQRRFVGFIAEEMQEIAPLLCTYDDGGESGTPNYVTYDRVTAYLVAVVQQQQQKIAALEARIH